MSCRRKNKRTSIVLLRLFNIRFYSSLQLQFYITCITHVMQKFKDKNCYPWSINRLFIIPFRSRLPLCFPHSQLLHDFNARTFVNYDWKKPSGRDNGLLSASLSWRLQRSYYFHARASRGTSRVMPMHASERGAINTECWEKKKVKYFKRM